MSVRLRHSPTALVKELMLMTCALSMSISACDFGLGSNPKTTISGSLADSKKTTQRGIFSPDPTTPPIDGGPGGGSRRGEIPGVYNISDETFYVGTSLQTNNHLALTSWSPACPPESGRMVCPIEYPIAGDFDGDGYATVGFYQPSNGQFRIRFSYNEAIPGDEIQFSYGPMATLDQPVLPLVGDWDGDGRDGIGVYLPRTSTFFLKNQLGAGPADITVSFGVATQEVVYPIAGDWNGDGIVGIGLYKPETGTFFLKNLPVSGPADFTFVFGPSVASLLPVTGKWTGGAQDFVGIYDPAKGEFNLRYSHQGGAADLTYVFSSSFSGEFPFAGFW